MAVRKIEKENEIELDELVTVYLDTMACVGKKITLAGKEYTVCPVNIRDMHFILNSGELYIPISSKEEEEEEGNMALQLVGLNITDESKARNFFYIVEKYCRYKDIPVTRKLVEEHNWSFKDIKKFLTFWSQIVSD